MKEPKIIISKKNLKIHLGISTLNISNYRKCQILADCFDIAKQQAELTREETIKECVEIARQVKLDLKITSGIDEIIKRLTKQNNV